MQITTPGVYDLTHAQYHADPCPTPSLSRSCIVDMLTMSPKHAALRHPKIGNQRDDDSTKVASIGTVAHALLLGKGEERIKVSPYDEFRTAEAKAWRDGNLARGMTIIKREGFAEAQAMIAGFRANMDKYSEELGESFPESGFEKTVVAQINGVWCRILIDALGKSIWDLKSTGTEYRPEKWGKNQHFGSGGDIQSAFYRRVLKAATGEDKRFISAVLEQNAPYDAYPAIQDEAGDELANEKIDWAIAAWKRGLEQDIWPGYAERVVYLSPPGYMKMDWEEFKLREEIAEKLRKVA